MATPRILVATVSWRAPLAKHIKCIFALERLPITQYMLQEGDALIERSRAIVATAFLEGTCEVLVSIDDDVSFDPQDVLTIAEQAVTHDIVAGIYVTRSQYNCIPSSHLMEDVPLTFGTGDSTPVPIMWAATGFCAVHRRVFEKLAKRPDMPLCHPDKPWHFHPFYTPFVSSDDQGRPIYLSEDFAFPLAPDTMVLGADWCWKPIGAFRIGDHVLALDEESPPHSSRRYREAEVTATIDRELPLWRVVAEDREFITTAEHPWLRKRSWRKPVGGGMLGRPGKGHRESDPLRNLGPPAAWGWCPTRDLQPGDYLAEVVPYGVSPDLTAPDYMAGYGQGLLHSDGTLSRDNHRGVIRMKDAEALERARRCLNSIGIRCTETPIRKSANPRHAAMHGIGVFERSAAQRLGGLMEYSEIPSPLFARGYLAGMYDGDGHSQPGVVFIHNTSEVLKHRVVQAGHMIGMDFTLHPRHVRVTGTAAVMRFRTLTRPAIPRKLPLTGQVGNDGTARNLEVHHKPVRIDAVEAVGRVGLVRCLTTTTGTFIAEGIATHNCQRAREEGFGVWANPAVALKHTGQYDFTLEDLHPGPFTLTRHRGDVFERVGVGDGRDGGNGHEPGISPLRAGGAVALVSPAVQGHAHVWAKRRGAKPGRRSH